MKPGRADIQTRLAEFERHRSPAARLEAMALASAGMTRQAHRLADWVDEQAQS